MVQSVGRGDEPLAVRTEAQVIGVDDVLDDAAALARLGVEHQKFVRRGRADQHFLAIGCDQQVMRLATDRLACEFGPATAAQGAVGCLFRVEDQDGIRPGRPGKA